MVGTILTKEECANLLGMVGVLFMPQIYHGKQCALAIGYSYIGVKNATHHGNFHWLVSTHYSVYQLKTMVKIPLAYTSCDMDHLAVDIAIEV